MNRHNSAPLVALLAWATLWISADSSVTYCSSDSTGSGAANFSIYQSNGNCEEHCQGSAFAILQEKNCWCSDIAPNEDTNVDASDCDDGCPGFPDDWCGNSTEGLYAYIQIGSPSGTASASSTSTSTTRESTSTTSSTSSTTTSSTSHPTTVTETHGNQVTTITVGDTNPTSPADEAQESNDDGGSGISGGTIAGIVVGVVGGIALVVAAIIFFLAKRRSRSEEDLKGPQMGYANAAGPFSDNHSSGGSPSTPQRVPTFTDNRLNTGAVLYPNGAPPSEVSLHDNQDYSRPVLRLTNPD
ncbi:hypothetical protein BJY04DRAFT_198052 [Aspergillus karnatakaensis]|uniref:uncharacterized protein n=1 Tax=Aspergillus karnatakaensis TaxID=1810916 RepID=UPI003CCD33F4